MRTPGWLWRRESDSFEQLVLAPLSVAGWIYGVGARLHRAAYRRGILPRFRPDCCVVSVGSPVVGGAGRTPTAAWIAARLHARGHRVALATRGHGGRRARDVRVLSDGHAVVGDPVGSGDEPLLLCAHAPGVPVLVSRDRVRAARVAIAAFDARVLVLDDGLAHHRLARDVEWVTLDAASGLGNGAVLPRGPLREPLPRLDGPRALGVVDGALATDDERRVTRWLPDAERYVARRRVVSVRPLGGGAAEAPASLAGVEVGVLSGIGRPEAFTRTVEALGARVVARRTRPDHHRYRPADLAGLAQEARVWVTTEKDAVKILPSWCRGLDLRVVRIALAVEPEKRLLDWLEACIEACPYPVRPSVGAGARVAVR